MPHDPRAIANEFIKFAKKQRLTNTADSVRFYLTAPQIERLVYYTYAYHLALNSTRLVSEQPVAAMFAPTFSSLAKALEPHGNDPVLDPLTDGGDYRPFWLVPTEHGQPFTAKLVSAEARSIRDVWAAFIEHPLESHQLSALIKGEEDAWTVFSSETGKHGAPRRMTDEDVKRFFTLTCEAFGHTPGDRGGITQAA